MAAPTLCPAGAWRLATICRPWAIRTVADRRRAVGMLPRAGFEALRVKSGLSPLRNIHRVRIGCAKGASANALGRQHPIRSIAGCRLQRSDVDQSRWPVGRRRNLVVDRKSDAARPRQRHARLLGAALLVGPPLPRSSRPRRFRGPGNGGACPCTPAPIMRACSVQSALCRSLRQQPAADLRGGRHGHRKGFDNGKLSADLIFAWRPADAPHATRPRPAC